MEHTFNNLECRHCGSGTEYVCEQCEEAIADVAYTPDQMLHDLLAVLHRDGGQHTARNGLLRSWRNAMKIASEAVVR